ncbi:MAG TPA: hypothetical protein VK009_21805 [Chloroflexota bacterium]|nr:hypothetical protein [Chloroflexota bacterium]
MIDPVDSLTLVIAQSPEAARMQMAVQQATLASALTPSVAAHLAQAAEDVMSVQPALRAVPISASESHAHNQWTYTPHPRKPGAAVATAMPGTATAPGSVGLLIDLGA